MTLAVREIAPAESVRGKHLLIVGINYAPETTGIAPYTTQMAEHLARSAGSVTVLTGLPSYPAWRVPPEYSGRWRMVERSNDVEVIRLRHHVPAVQTALRRGLYEATFMAHVAVTRLTRSPDVVLAVTPSIGGAAAAASIARRNSSPLIVVVQDLLANAAEQSGIPGGGAVAGMASRLEGWVLRQATRVALVSGAMRPAVEAYGVRSDQVSDLRNWSHVSPGLSHRDDVRRQFGWAPDVKVALHTGNMGLKQDLGNVIEAARLASGDSALRWVLMGEGSQRALLQAQASGLVNVEFLSPCSATDYPNVLQAADVLILNERASVTDMSLPSKLTSYFMSGKPVAAAVATAGATFVELETSAAAVCVPAGAPAKLRYVVGRLTADPQLSRQLGDRGLDYAARHLTSSAAMRRLDDLLAI